MFKKFIYSISLSLLGCMIMLPSFAADCNSKGYKCGEVFFKFTNFGGIPYQGVGAAVYEKKGVTQTVLVNTGISSSVVTVPVRFKYKEADKNKIYFTVCNQLNQPCLPGTLEVTTACKYSESKVGIINFNSAPTITCFR